MLGRTLRHYRIESKLGEGGMGIVYRALDTHLDRPVAIKFLAPEAVANLERKKRFVQEAKAASALSHPNIVTIHDIDTADGIDFIVMEYVAGKSLDRLIGRKGLALREALQCAVQVADALSAAHRAGIVHRDLKPGNVMVSDSGHVKLLDFGLAKLTEPPDSDESAPTETLRPRTEEGTILGTVAYMSPEQAEGKKVDARSDIFSFGSVLYEIVTGRGAFHGDSKLATLSAILHQEPKPLSEAGELPHDLEKIVARCLRKDPARRFQDIDDLKIALDELKEESESGALQSRPLTPGLRPRRWVVALAAVAFLAVAAALWFARSRTGPPEESLTAIPLTTYAGREYDPSFSPDGSQVAFAWDGEKQDNTDIYVKLVDAGTPLRLTTHSARDFGPAWAPDGRHIAFLRSIGSNRAAVLQIPALGGPERKLAEIIVTSSDTTRSFLFWSPDSRCLVMVDRKAPGEPTELFVLAIATGEKRSLISPPAKSIGDTDPTVSPDGRALAFSRSPSYAVSDLWVLPLAEDLRPRGEAKPLTSDHRQVGGCAWTPDGREILFSSNRAGSFALWRIAASGSGQPVRLASVGDAAVEPAISRPGAGRRSRLAYVRPLGGRDIRRLDVQSGVETQVVSSTRDDHFPQYSPDGSRIAFSTNRSGADEIWVCQNDGSSPQPLTSFRGPIADLPAWSPDGRRIAFHFRPEGTADIYVIDADGGPLRRLTNEPGDDVAPSWSHEGRWIYFGSNRTGEHQIWRLPAEGGPAVQVTRNGGIYAQESPDGKFLFYTKTRGANPLWKAPLSNGVVNGPESQVAPSIFYLNFAVRTEGVYFSPPRSIQFLPFAGGPAKTVAALEKSPNGLSVSPDGTSFVYAVAGPSGSDIMLVENFR